MCRLNSVLFAVILCVSFGTSASSAWAAKYTLWCPTSPPQTVQSGDTITLADKEAPVNVDLSNWSDVLAKCCADKRIEGATYEIWAKLTLPVVEGTTKTQAFQDSEYGRQVACPGDKNETANVRFVPPQDLQGELFGIAFFLIAKKNDTKTYLSLLKLKEDDKEYDHIRVEYEIPEPEKKPTTRLPDVLSEEQLQQALAEQHAEVRGDGKYHVYLYPSGRRAYPSARRSPIEDTPVRGQLVVLDWYVPKRAKDRYDVIVTKGELYRPGALLEPAKISISDLTGIEDLRDAQDYEWKAFALGRFEGGQTIEVWPTWDGAQLENRRLQLYVRRQDRFALRAGPVSTPLGDTGIAAAPGTAAGTFVIAQQDRGDQLHAGAGVIICPWRDRDFSVTPPNVIERFNVVVETTVSDFASTWLYGFSFEIAPGFELATGWIYGKEDALKAGYSFGDSFDGNVDAVKTTSRKTESFWGLTFGIELYDKIFGKKK